MQRHNTTTALHATHDLCSRLECFRVCAVANLKACAGNDVPAAWRHALGCGLVLQVGQDRAPAVLQEVQHQVHHHCARTRTHAHTAEKGSDVTGTGTDGDVTQHHTGEKGFQWHAGQGCMRPCAHKSCEGDEAIICLGVNGPQLHQATHDAFVCQDAEANTSVVCVGYHAAAHCRELVQLLHRNATEQLASCGQQRLNPLVNLGARTHTTQHTTG